MDYRIRKETDAGFDATVERTRKVLADEGFGILSEIDVAAKMKEKLDKDLGPYLILGACAPPLAWKALGAERDLGVLLPCNVVVHEEGGRTVVAAMEPEAALELVGDATVAEVAREVSARLHRVVDTVTKA